MPHREIIRYDGTEANYLDKFKYALNSKSDRGRFPDDGEFVEAFEARPVYEMNSIEHIMPQHLTPAWIKELGEDYEQIHETWQHRIANLTLTGYNAKYSNSVFTEKRDMKDGFSDSHLYLNKWISQQKNWGLAELESRNQILMQRALTIWSLPATSYHPAEKQMDSYSLYDDVDLSGRSIVRFSYRNTEQPVTSWIEL